MPKSQKNYRLRSLSSEHKPSLKKTFLDICSLRPPQIAIYPVRIVHAKGRVRIWTLDSSGKLSTRLANTDLEALAFTFLASHSSIRGSLKLSGISNNGIHATLSCSPPTAPFSMTASKTLYPAGLHRRTGLGDERQDLQSPPY